MHDGLSTQQGPPFPQWYHNVDCGTGLLSPVNLHWGGFGGGGGDGGVVPVLRACVWQLGAVHVTACATTASLPSCFASIP